MINIFIILSITTTLILIGIKYNFLNVLSSILAILALAPIVGAIGAYFLQCPRVEFQIANIQIEKTDGGYLYKCWIGIMGRGGSGIIQAFYISPEENVIPFQHPDGGNKLKFLLPILEESHFNALVSVDMEDSSPIFSHKGFAPLLAFKTPKEKKQFNIKLILDVSTDPMKQGYFAIFSNLFHYRLYSDVKLNIDSTKPIEGYLKRRYF